MRTYKIHFIRHGLTEGNVEGKYIGITDLSLSEKGAEQLEAVRVSGILPDTQMVFTSPLSRCTESCEILFPDATPIVIDEFKEYNFGDFENKSVYELDGKPEYIEWTSGRVSSPPNGEDASEFTLRICKGLRKAVQFMMEAEVFEASVVIHGGVMMSLFAATALPQRKAVEWTCKAGNGFTALITPSLYGRSGVIEIINAIQSEQ